ncbi:MAG TPA: hypothetical protein K8V32_00020 [Enteractinococcus helveticum]|uniref:Di-and tripeptidase n=1 Tax=Enteractinococcus helveticum TaxID=1837282 RepID=A0A921K5Z1_9MICC|nr:hypothetical protein [Enteractinococcus helveticum]HJF13175.1 hypothetical protein [Enteractinococcus helveticum]
MPDNNEIPTPKNTKTKRSRRDKAARNAQKILGKAVDSQGRPTPAFQRAVLGAMSVQRPLVIAELRRLTKKYPQDSPGELADRLSRRYIASLTTTGAAAGGVGGVPGIGTAASLGASFGAALGFLEFTALYAQSVAELAGLDTKDSQESKALVMTILLGEEGRELLKQAANAQPGTRFGTLGPTAWIASGISGITERAFNTLANRFMKTLLRGETLRFFGRLVPFGIGAGIGGFANRALARQVVAQTQETFGQLPQWYELPELFAELNTKPERKSKQLKAGKQRAAIESAASADSSSPDE